MRKAVALVVVSVFMFFMLAIVNSKADQYPSVNQALCAKYLQMASKALESNNLPLAKLFARKAVQADVYNMTAWKTYDSIIVKMSHGNVSEVNSMPVSKPKKPSVPKAETPQAPSGGGAFEGC